VDEAKIFYVRPAEAARMLSISRAKIYMLLRAGALPSRRFGAAIRVPVAAIERMAREDSDEVRD
jgi:excisionase family DNA binding protein